MLSYMRGNLESMLKIYIYFIINEQKNIQKDNYIPYMSSMNLPRLKLCVLLTEHCCPAPMGAVRPMGTEQSLQRKGLGSLTQRKQQFAPSLMRLENGFIDRYKAKEGKEASIQCPRLVALHFFKFPIQKAEM